MFSDVRDGMPQATRKSGQNLYKKPCRIGVEIGNLVCDVFRQNIRRFRLTTPGSDSCAERRWRGGKIERARKPKNGSTARAVEELRGKHRPRLKTAFWAVLGASARGVRDRVGSWPVGKGWVVPLSRVIVLERPRSDDGPNGLIFTSFPRGSGASPKRFWMENRTRSPSSLFPAGFFGSIIACPFPWLPTVRAPSWGPSLGFRWLRRYSFPWLPLMANLWGGFGRGLTPPPNHRAVSEANSFVAPQQSYPQPESYPQTRRFRLSDFR
jgi:hypothetical protein